MRIQLKLMLWAVVSLLVSVQTSSAADAPLGGKVREYYVAAEETNWNFAPAGRDEVMGEAFNSDQKVYTAATDKTIGSVFHMARYFAYKDKDWKVRDNSADPSNGILGPIFHAEVGDRIIVHLLNRTTVNVSLHPHGVFYKKDSEGSMTNDKTTMAEMEDDSLPPNHFHTYIWDVPERAGPGPNDASSVVWLYHSHVDEVRDTNTGLFGAMVITAKGMADADGKPKDVDKEEFSFFGILDQNKNLFLPKMIAKLKVKPHEPKDEDFEESNKKHTINGYIYGSQPIQKMKVGERVRWYVFALGTETDLHTPHWHGNTVLVRGHREDVVELMPATTVVADMVPDNPGIWMYHCHVNDHIAAGMMTRYQVLPK
jgi:FtsP/CotA-like multicopper oxidase with cupredoxin domain